MNSKSIIALSLFFVSNSALPQISEIFQKINKLSDSVNQLGQGIEKINGLNKSNTVGWDQYENKSNKTLSENVKAEDEILKTIIETGYGKTITEATQNAAKEALINVVGSYLDTNTFIQNKERISDGLKSKTKDIIRDVNEYSQGAIKGIKVLDVKEESLIKVTAEVTVRMHEIQAYSKSIESSTTKIGPEIAAQNQITKNQISNISSIIQKRIIDPIVSGQGVEIDSKILPAEEFKGDDFNKLARKYGSGSVIGLAIRIRLKDPFEANLVETLNSVSFAKKILYGDGEVGEFYYHGKSFDYQRDVLVTMQEKRNGQINFNKILKISPQIQGSISVGSMVEKYNQSTAYESYVMKDALYSVETKKIAKNLSLIMEFKKDNAVLQREIVDRNILGSWGNDSRVRVLYENMDRGTNPNMASNYELPWALVESGHSGQIKIRRETQFIVIVATQDGIIDQLPVVKISFK